MRVIDPPHGARASEPPSATSRDELERALQWQEAIFEGSRDAIFISDTGARFIAVNRAACELTGYPREELLRKRIPDLHEDIDLDAYRQYHDRIMAGEEILSEAMILRQDGTKLHAEFSNRRIVIDGVPYMHTTARDISRRRGVETALRESDALLRMVFDGSNDAIFIVSLDGRILEANLTASRRLGYSVEELTRMSVAEVISQQAAAGIGERLAAVMDTGHAIFETVHRRRDGTTIPTEISASLIDYHGAPAALGMCRDVSERKRAEDLLHESAARYRSLVDHASDGICISQDGFLRLVNPAMARLSGYSESELTGRSFIGFVHPDDRALVAAFTARRARGLEVPPAYEFRIVRADGEVRWARNSATPIEWNGRPATLNFLTDVTPRREAEAALRESEERYRALFESSPIPMWLYDPRTLAILEVNAAAVQRYGYSREEFLAMGLHDMHPREDADAVARIASTDRPTPFHVGVWAHRTKDGTVIDVDIHRQQIVLGGQAVRVSVLHDVTEVRGLVRALEREKDRLRLLVEAAPFAIMQVADDGRVLYVNPKFTALLGYELPDVPDLARWRELAYPDPAYRRGVVETWERDVEAIRAGATIAHTYTVRTKTGRDLVMVFHSFFTRGGERVLTCEDVTEARSLEAQLRHAQKLEAVGRLAGGIAHDFNNLLQAMLSQVQLSRISWRPREVELADLEAQIRRGAGLARQLLLFSRHEEVRRTRLDLNELIRNAHILLLRLVRENIELAVELGPGVVPLEADPGQIDQVLMNLVVNAADAMPAGGRLTIRTGRDGDHAWLTVADTGSGIPETILDKIFEPYFTTKASGHGTGLGLSVVHGIVSEHGGRIEVASRVGAGTTFRVVLPAASAGGEPQPLAEITTDLPRGRGERVLLVEDEAFARASLGEILASLGYAVTAVGSAADAGRLPDATPFDLLLTDMMLPDTDGAALARGLIDRWPGLKVVLMSGYSEDEAMRRAAELGDVAFLQKPFDMTVLARAVRDTLDANPSP